MAPIVFGIVWVIWMSAMVLLPDPDIKSKSGFTTDLQDKVQTQQITEDIRNG